MKKTIFFTAILCLFSCKNENKDEFGKIPVVDYYDNESRQIKTIGNYQPRTEFHEVRVSGGLKIRETYTRKEILPQLKRSGLLEMVKPFDPGVIYQDDSPVILSVVPGIQSRLLLQAEIQDIFPEDLEFCWSLEEEEIQVSGKTMRMYNLYAVKNSGKSIGHQDIARSSATEDENTLQKSVNIEMTDAGQKKFANLTRTSIKKTLAITVDGVVLSAPVVQGVISNGEVQIAGNFSEQDAKSLSKTINAYVLYGEWRSYHKNGKLKEIRHYENGQQVGAWSAYDENGKLTKKGEI